MIRRLEIAQSMLHRPAGALPGRAHRGPGPRGPPGRLGASLELRDRSGTTVLLTTHDMEEADSLCSRWPSCIRRVAAIGTPAALKDSLGARRQTLDDVFVHYAGGTLETGGSYREASSARRTARRLG